MCLILQKLNQCLNSSNVTTNEVGFWCLYELYAIKIVLATLVIHHNISPTLCDDQRWVQKNQLKERRWENVMWKTVLSAPFPYKEVLSFAFMEMQKVWPGVLKLAFHFCHLKEIVQEDLFLSVFSLLWVWGFFSSLRCRIFLLWGFACSKRPSCSVS